MFPTWNDIYPSHIHLLLAVFMLSLSAFDVDSLVSSSYDEIIVVLDYMIKTGSQDLRYFNSSINTAITIAKCKKEYRTEGTDSYLVAYFHKKTGQKLTDKIMLQGMKKITELKNEGYNYDQIEITIEYMIEKKVNIFNFINNYIEEALKNGKTKDKLLQN